MIRTEKVFYWLIVPLALTSLSFFQVGMAEFTLFHGVAFTVLLCAVLMGNYRSVHFSVPRLFLPVLLYVCAINLWRVSHMKPSSFVYTLVILLELLLLYNVSLRLSMDVMIRAFRIIVAIYAVNIIIASVFLLFRYVPDGFLGWVFKVYDFDGRIRPYAFSDEPSYAAIILVFCSYVLASIREFRIVRSDIYWNATIIVTVLLTGSAYGYLLLFIFLVYFIFRSGILTRTAGKALEDREFSVGQLAVLALIPLLLAGIVIAATNFDDNRSVQRLLSLYRGIASSQDDLISTVKRTAFVDGSASLRLVPTIRLLESIPDHRTVDMALGYGAAQSIPFFSSFYIGHTIVLGFIPAFVFNYGFLGAALFFVFFLCLVPKRKFIFVMLFVPFLLNADFNTQIFLFVLFCGMCARRAELLISQHDTR